MPIVFSYDGKTLDLDDVPMDEYAAIEKTTSVPWYRLTQSPLREAAAGQMLARRCAEILEVKLPDEITPRVFVDLFEVIADEPNRPVEFNDGIPDPKVEDSGAETI